MRKFAAVLSCIAAVLFSADVQAQIVGTLPYSLTNGTPTDAAKVMSNYNYIIAQVNANAATAGNNSNITAITGLATPLTASQGGSQLYTAGTTTGTGNAQVIGSGITPTGFALSGKPTICFTAGATNTGATTLNVNSTGVTNVFKRNTAGTSALTGGELTVNGRYCAQYDGTQYQLLTINEPLPAVYVAGTTTGAANAQVLATTTPSGYALSANVSVCFKAGFTNTSATTLNVGGTGATNVYKRSLSGPLALTGNEITINNVYCVQYDGTQYELTYDATLGSGAGGAKSTLTAGATTDLGTMSSHNVYVSGAATITSFGSSASTVGSVYFVTFSGGQVITYNATSMILPGAVSYTVGANDFALMIYLGSGNWQMYSYYPGAFPGTNLGKTPTVQKFSTPGSTSYTPTAGTLYARVRMVGGGGCGAVNISTGTNGGATTMNNGGGNNWSAPGGFAGNGTTTNNSTGSGGASATSFTVPGSGPFLLVAQIVGSAGGNCAYSGGASPYISSCGGGAASAFGGGTSASATAAAPAGQTACNINALTTTMVYGSGNGGVTSNSAGCGGGGSSAGYLEFYIWGAYLLSNTITVGAAGNNGALSGGGGYVIIEEFYS